jgi:hypothetical protein
MNKERKDNQRAVGSWPTPWRESEATQDAPLEDRLLCQTMQTLAKDIPQAPPGAAFRILDNLNGRPVKRFSIIRPVVVGLATSFLALIVVLVGFHLATQKISFPSDLKQLQIIRGTAQTDQLEFNHESSPYSIKQDESLSLSERALAVADIGERGRILLHEQVSLSVPLAKQNTDLIHLYLHSGEIVVNYPSEQSKKIVVSTSHGEVRVTGTIFGVRVDQKGSQVSVWQGSVEVKFDGHQEKVSTGQKRSSQDGFSKLETHRKLESEERILLGLAPRQNLAPQPKADQAVATLSAKPVSQKKKKIPDVQPAPPEPDVVKQEKNYRLLDQEQRLLALAKTEGETAANALFSLGALRYDLLKKPLLAQEAWQEYLDRFPQGAFRGEIHLALFEHFRHQKDFILAVEHGQKALEAVSDVLRTTKLRLALGEVLHLKLNQPDKALIYYQSIADKSGIEADHANYLMIDCYQRLNKPEQVRAALKNYLERFPRGIYRNQVEAAMSRSSHKK